jgi:arsenite methyltransferase
MAIISAEDDIGGDVAGPALVREHYGRIAATGACCDAAGGSTFSLGSGDVIGAAGLKPGERVLDLGSGTGHDALRAAELVGPSGRVDGVDFTPEMLARARAAAATTPNVSFHEADIARLPFVDSSFDVVLTNCVVNLTENKRAVFNEARRVLRPGGRLVISDIVFATEPSAEVRENDSLACACVGGAALLGDYLTWLREAGFSDVRLVEGHTYGTHGGAHALAVTLVATEGLPTQASCC